jgi:predicted short-subunit dehydrogenase-like oxidoreductase (DUF2520 family)
VPLAALGFTTGSLHPWCRSAIQLPDIAICAELFCLEVIGQPGLARRIVNDLGGHAFLIKPQNKPQYHAAAVLASGHMTALFDIAVDVLSGCGLSRRRAREALLPLLQSAVTNLSAMDPAQALTGTFARGDVATVERHLAAIQAQSAPEALAAYVLLGRRSLSLARKTRLTAATADRISTLLERSEKSARCDRFAGPLRPSVPTAAKPPEGCY